MHTDHKNRQMRQRYDTNVETHMHGITRQPTEKQKTLKISFRHISTGFVITVVAALFAYTYRTGYGIGHMAVNAGSSTVQEAIAHSTLDVIYERTENGRSDFLHLQVDTAYNARGKGSFRMRPTCSRTMAIRSFDGKYRPTGIAPTGCFVENGSGTPQWRDTGTTRRIMGYDCRCAEASFNGRTWQVWYTDRLPYCADGITPADGSRGLILEACAANDSYSLKVRYIAQKIG